MEDEAAETRGKDGETSMAMSGAGAGVEVCAEGGVGAAESSKAQTRARCFWFKLQ